MNRGKQPSLMMHPLVMNRNYYNHRLLVVLRQWGSFGCKNLPIVKLKNDLNEERRPKTATSVIPRETGEASANQQGQSKRSGKSCRSFGDSGNKSKTLGDSMNCLMEHFIHVYERRYLKKN